MWTLYDYRSGRVFAEIEDPEALEFACTELLVYQGNDRKTAQLDAIVMARDLREEPIH